MSARLRRGPRALGALLAFVAMSAVAGLLATAMVTPALAVTGMAASNTIGVFEGLPEYLKIENLAQRSTMYATQGGKPVPIAQFYAQDRQEVSWQQIPQVVKDAAVSTEDPRFYEHGGVDIMGTFRGAISTALHRGVQGGSSITQQYVKNVLISKCEVYDRHVDDATQQKALDKQYQDCYQDATAVTPNRKLREIKLAIGVEKRYTKDQILRGYLNIAGFGGVVYGIQAAARHYFGIDASQLDLPQAATLVAILNNPNNLRIDRSAASLPGNNADNGFKATLVRRNYVLDRMLTAKTITQQQHDEAIKTAIEPHITNQPNGCATAAAVDAAFFCTMVQNRILDDPTFGATADQRANFLREGGLQIYTTLNLDLQNEAQGSLSKYIPPTSSRLNLGAASTAVELNTGRVVMMVQNRPYDVQNTDAPGVTLVNYAADYLDGGSSGFQTGSTYKAFTLLDWIEEGHSIFDRVTASNTTTTIPASRWHNSCGPVDKWEVGNDGPGEGGTMTVEHATAFSVNTAFAAMGQRLDLCKITQTAKDLGIHPAFPWEVGSDGKVVRDADGQPKPSELYTGPSSILGVNTLSPLTLATAYGGIANGGKWCSSVVIDRIVNAAGKDIPVPQTSCTQGVSPDVTARAIPALQQVLTDGTARLAEPGDGTPILGKTGTTDHAEQNWLATSTTKVATATWVGNVAGTRQPNGTIGNLNFANIYFDGVWGRNVKFSIVKPILQTLNDVYGGDDFPTPSKTRTAARQVTVPDLAGRSVDDAKTILDGLGFEYADGGQVDSSQQAGLVATTEPGPNTTADYGSTVTVRTSNGSLKPLPNVVDGQTTFKQATAALVAIGMKTIENGSDDPDALVTGMDPQAGTAVKAGTTVTLTVRSRSG